MKADFTGSVKPGSELAPPLTDDIACLGLIGSVLTSRIQVYKVMDELVHDAARHHASLNF